MTKSVGVYVAAKVLELRHTIKLIQFLDEEINSPIESIPVSAFVLLASLKQKLVTFNVFLRQIFRQRLINRVSSLLKIQLFALYLVLSGSSRQYSFKNFCYLLEEKACRR